MLDEIKINGIATFTNETKIDELKKINFFYGANGSGKTTISKIIATPESYSTCEVSWQQNEKMKTLVFNEDFITEYFYKKDELLGIYTIGGEEKKIEEEIVTKNNKCEELQNEIDKLRRSLVKKEQDQDKFFNNFKENCWNNGFLTLKTEFDSFFVGYKSNKNNFANKILEEKSSTAQLLKKENLKEKYDLIYDKNIQTINELPLINVELKERIEKLETNQNILQTPIIGKKDVNIAKMIEKLHNHDWVKQGKAFYEKNYNEEKGAYVCPFCQQLTSDEFKKQLEEYFDESYKQSIEELENFINVYSDLSDDIKTFLDQILKNDNKYLNENKNTLQDKLKIIEEIMNNNLQKLEVKINKPSETIKIETIIEHINGIILILNDINKKIKEHNLIVNNKEKEKQRLNAEIWKFIVSKLQSDIDNYEYQKNDIDKALESLNKQIYDKETDINNLNKEIAELEKKIKSVKPTVNAINKILDSFGFRGFKLKPTDDNKHYQVIRNDGSDAKKTLSEGERNFLVFLYFYHLIYGAENPEEEITQDKILVIDDPVSSLDSEILFIVSTLIRSILDRVRDTKRIDTVKQVLLFTHNAYFFREITFISSRESCYNRRNDTMYFIVRKMNNISLIDKFEECPIKTSYQLLWDDIKKENVDCVSVQNSMRRIIEFYFKFLANLDENKLIDKFQGQEKTYVKA